MYISTKRSDDYVHKEMNVLMLYIYEKECEYTGKVQSSIVQSL